MHTQTSQRTFIFRCRHTHTHTPGGGGGGAGLAGEMLGTFTAATFFAHLLTLRMFRVYFFNPVTLRKDFFFLKEKRTSKGRGHTLFWSFLPRVFISFLFVSCFCFFVLTVTPARNQGIPTGMGCQRALCLESSRTRKQCTLTLPLPLQKLKRL